MFLLLQPGSMPKHCHAWREQYIAIDLSSSHTVAFMRCIHNDCKDPTGKLPEESRTDPCWDAITHGWTMSGLGLQCAGSRANPPRLRPHDIQHQPPLPRPSIAHFVQRLAGGDQFLSNFGHMYGATLVMGEVRSSRVLWSTKISGMPHACSQWSALHVGPQRSPPDGFAKILVANDFQKLQTMAHNLMDAETRLADAWQAIATGLANQQASGTKSKQTHRYKCMGRLYVRTILFLTKKQKHSRESKRWETLKELTESFTHEVQGTSSSPRSHKQ